MNKLMRHGFALAFAIVTATPFATAQDFSSGEYDKALWMTTRFYGAQRSGYNNWLLYNHLPSGYPEAYRGTAFIDDADGSYDLSGGWHDCGDHVKFGQTQFYSAYLLLKGYDEFPEGYDDYYSFDYTGYNTSGDYTWAGGQGQPNGIPDILDELKHECDFLIKCAKNSSEFYYQVGTGGGSADHCEFKTATYIQNNPPSCGGNDYGNNLRPVGKNPNGASMASFCAATLALMSEAYRPFDETYADLCLVHAQYAYDYAQANPGEAGTAFGGFYGPNGNWKNAWACANAELYRATGNTSYRTTAYALTTGADNSGDVHPNAGYTFDYENTGEIGLYALAQIGHPTAQGHFNTRITNNFLNAGNYNGENVYTGGGGWGMMRYVGNAALMVSLYNKLNGTSLNSRVYDNIDFIMGSNNATTSFIVGYVPPLGGASAAQNPHHRNVYLDDSGNAEPNGGTPIPFKNQEFGAVVGGNYTSTSYVDDRTQYVNTEVCIDYNAGLVGGLAAIKAELNPIDTNKFLTQCSAPDLGSDQSLCGVGSVTLNTGVSPNGTITFEWFLDGVSQGAPSTTQNSRVVSTGGTWSVEIDSVGECQRTDQVEISSTLPTVDLGPDQDLCSPSSVTLDAGASGGGISYAWTKDGSAYGGNTQTILVSEAGNYGVTISASGCSDESDNIIITSSLPTPIHDTICAAGTANPAVSGAGNYDWYDQSTGGSFLGNGNSISQSIASTTAFYVEDNSSFSANVGPSTIVGAMTNWGVNTSLHTNFSFTTDFTINSLKVPFDIYSNGSGTITVEVLDNNGNPLSPAQTFTSESTTVTSGNDQLVQFDFTGFDIQTAWGTDLRLRLTSVSVNGDPNWNTAGASFPYNSTPTSGLVTITGESGGQGGGGEYMYFYDWDISSGVSCDRATVYAVIDGANPSCSGGCDDPGTATLSPSSPPAQCGGSVTLTASESGTGSFEYEFFRGGVSVQGPGASNTYNATQSGSYTVEITDPSDPGTCVSVSSAVSVTIDDAPSTASAGTNQTVCEGDAVNLSANNPTTGTGVWSTISGTGTADSPSSNTSSVSGLTAGASTTFRWTISNGVCPDETDEVTITVDAAPSTASAGANQTVCEGTAVNLSATNPSTGTGSWSTVSGTGTADSPSSNTSSVSGLTAGASTTFRWTVSNGVCTDETDDVAVTVDAAPSTSFAGTNQTVCSSTATLSANNPSIGTGSWSTVSGTGTADSPSSNTSTVSGLTAGTTTLRWTVSNGVCPDETSDVDITRSGSITTASAGSDQTICETDVVNLSANAAGGGETGTWTSSGDGTFSNANDENATYTPGGGDIASGTVTLTWTIDNGICTPSADDMTVTIDQSPSTASAGTNQTVCETDVVNLSANNPTTGTGVWSTVTGTGTADSPSSNTSSVSGLTGGASTTFRWTISNGVCPDVNDEVIITADASPSTADAGTDQTVCDGDAVNLSANNPSIGTGSWSTVSGTGTADSPSSNTSSVSGLTGGASTTFRWTISNGVCADETSDVTVSVDALPSTAFAGTDQTVCDGDAVNLSANNPAIGTGIWSTVSGSGTADSPSSSSSSVSGLTGGASTTFRWTVSNGVCSDETDDVTINVDQQPTTSNAGIDSDVCTADPISLTGNNPTIGTGLWTTGPATTGGTIDSPTQHNSNVSGLSGGDVLEAIWTISNGTCPSSSDTVTFTGQAVAAANVSLSADLSQVCEGTSVTFTAVGVNGGSAPTYEFFDGSNNSLQAASGTSTFVLSATTIDTNIYVEMVSNSSCLGANPSTVQSSTVFVQVDQNPTAATAGLDDSYCAADYTLQGNSPTVGSGTWTLAGGSATINSPSDPNSTVTIPVGQVATFDWTISNGVCPSSTDQVEITNSCVTCTDPGTATLSPLGPVTQCGGNVTLTASESGTGSFEYEFYLDGLSIQGPSATNTYSATISGNYHVVITDPADPGTCFSTSNTVTVTIDQAPDAANAGSPQSLCTNSTTLAANTPVVGTGTWSVISGSGSFADASDPTTSVTGLMTGSNVFQWTISNGSCPDETDQVTITVSGSATADVSITEDANPICNGDNVCFTATPTNGGASPTYEWFVNGGSVQGPSATDTYCSAALSNADQIHCVMTSSLGCATNNPATSNTVNMTVNSTSTASVSIVADQTTICSGTNVTFTATPTNGGTPTYQWKLNGGNVGTNSDTYANSTLNNGDVVEVEMTSSMTCVTGSPASSNQVTMTVNDVPGATGTISGNTTVCTNASGEAYTIASVSGATSYSWSATSATVVSGDGTTSVTIDFGSASSTVTVTPSNSCGNGTTANLSVTVNSCGPTPDFMASSNSVCEENQTVTFSDASSGLSGGETYTWDFGADADPSGTTGAGPHTVTYMSSGSKTVTLTINDGATDYVETKTAFITVKARPVTSPITGASNVDCDAVENYTVTDNPGSTYNWNIPIGVLSGNPNSSVSVDFTGEQGTGLLSVIEINNGCFGDPSVLPVSVCITPVDGITELEAEVYPNPTASYSVVIAHSTSSEPLTIYITDVHGITLNEIQGNTNEQISVGDELTAGVYIIRIVAGKKLYTTRFVKMN